MAEPVPSCRLGPGRDRRLLPAQTQINARSGSRATLGDGADFIDSTTGFLDSTSARLTLAATSTTALPGHVRAESSAGAREDTARELSVETPHFVETFHAYSMFCFHVAKSFQDHGSKCRNGVVVGGHVPTGSIRLLSLNQDCCYPSRPSNVDHELARAGPPTPQ
jgi:hypothetical protein